MSETLLIILILVGGILTAQNVVFGFATGTIELRSVKVARSDQPWLFWFVLTTEVIFILACIWLLMGWVTGTYSLMDT